MIDYVAIFEKTGRLLMKQERIAPICPGFRWAVNVSEPLIVYNVKRARLRTISRIDPRRKETEGLRREKRQRQREEPAARNNYTRPVILLSVLKTSREVHSPEYPEELCRCTDWFYDAPLCSYLARHRLILRCCRSFNASLTPNISPARGPSFYIRSHTCGILTCACCAGSTREKKCLWLSQRRYYCEQRRTHKKSCIDNKNEY